MISYAKITFA